MISEPKLLDLLLDPDPWLRGHARDRLLLRSASPRLGQQLLACWERYGPSLGLLEALTLIKLDAATVRGLAGRLPDVSGATRRWVERALISAPAAALRLAWPALRRHASRQLLGRLEVVLDVAAKPAAQAWRELEVLSAKLDELDEAEGSLAPWAGAIRGLPPSVGPDILDDIYEAYLAGLTSRRDLAPRAIAALEAARSAAAGEGALELAAIELLGRWRHRQSLQQLLALLDREAYETTESLRLALCRMVRVEDLPRLRELWALGRDPRCDLLASAIGAVGGPQAEQQLLALHDGEPDPERRAELAEELLSLGSIEGIARARACLRSEDNPDLAAGLLTVAALHGLELPDAARLRELAPQPEPAPGSASQELVHVAISWDPSRATSPGLPDDAPGPGDWTVIRHEGRVPPMLQPLVDAGARVVDADDGSSGPEASGTPLTAVCGDPGRCPCGSGRRFGDCCAAN